MKKGFTAANAITGVRILCAPGLLFCPFPSPAFTVLYLTGGVSDLADGYAARRLGQETKLGARLDTAADLLFFLTALTKFLVSVPLPRFLPVWAGCIALFRLFCLFFGLAARHTLVAEHTVPNKICGGLLFALPLCRGILPDGAFIALAVLTACAATAASVHEGYLIFSGKETT